MFQNNKHVKCLNICVYDLSRTSHFIDEISFGKYLYGCLLWCIWLTSQWCSSPPCPRLTRVSPRSDIFTKLCMKRTLPLYVLHQAFTPPSCYFSKARLGWVCCRQCPEQKYKSEKPFSCLEAFHGWALNYSVMSVRMCLLPGMCRNLQESFHAPFPHCPWRGAFPAAKSSTASDPCQHTALVIGLDPQ